MNFIRHIRIMWVIRAFAGLCVIIIASLTATLAYHVRVKPVEGKLSNLIPEPGSMNPHEDAISYARSLETRKLPDIEPGAQAFQKATELLAGGKLDEAREKLTTIFNIFPNSSVAKTSRRIVGDMNLDALLGASTGHGRSIYKVRPGDSYLAIAAKHDTSIPMMIHLNSMKKLRGIQPGHELVVMPLNFRLLIDQRRQAVSIWDEGRFICEYPALSMKALPSKNTKTSVKQIIAGLGGGSIPSHHPDFCEAEKIIQLNAGSLQIRGWDGPLETTTEEEDELPHGVLLSPEHMEELSLLMRRGNSVEIR